MNRYSKTDKIAGASSLVSKGLLGQVRYPHYSLEAEMVCLYWVQFFVLQFAEMRGMRPPRDTGVADV